MSEGSATFPPQCDTPYTLLRPTWAFFLLLSIIRNLTFDCDLVWAIWALCVCVCVFGGSSNKAENIVKWQAHFCCPPPSVLVCVGVAGFPLGSYQVLGGARQSTCWWKPMKYCLSTYSFHMPLISCKFMIFAFFILYHLHYSSFSTTAGFCSVWDLLSRLFVSSSSSFSLVFLSPFITFIICL